MISYAYLTNIRPFTGMELAVRHQMTLQRERSTALLAHKRTVAGVDSQVSQQMMFEREAFLAFPTLIRTLGRVQ